jgi:hypothetical protein
MREGAQFAHKQNDPLHPLATNVAGQALLKSTALSLREILGGQQLAASG